MQQILTKIVLITLFLTIPASAFAMVDTDSDGLSDADEIEIYGSNPDMSDSDSDGYLDGEEISAGYTPLSNNPIKLDQIDSDKDGLWDDWEIALKTGVNTPDTDEDRLNDGAELTNGTDPRGTDEKLPKTIIIRLSDQSLHYFYGKTRLSGFKISSGLPKTPTPPGTYAVIRKRPLVQYGGTGFDFFYPNTKWNLMFKHGTWGNYYIHGAYWHNNFGHKMSHGCVNAPYTDETMGRLYDWADTGTKVVVQP